MPRWQLLHRALLLLAALTVAGCSEPRPVRLAGAVMGTTWSVQLVGDVQPDLRPRIQARLDAIDARMTTYSATSELARFNASDSTQWVSVSGELVRVVAEALRIGELTGGAFNITAGPLVELWGFGAASAIDAPPAPQSVAAVRERVSLTHLAVRTTPAALRKTRPDVALDLSALAKGYAVDQVAALLENLGFRRYLVEVGGELRGRGRSARGEPWRIAVEQPAAGARRVQRAFPLRDLAVATSGDYRNFFELNGKRYSHAIDPRSGYPVAHGLASVTVLDPSAMSADAFATGLLVLGEEAGYAFALSHDIPALFVVREDSGYRERMTPRFSALTASS